MSDPASTDFDSRFTTTRFASFPRVFKRNPRSAFERRIARLTVLYEDLRVEVFGVKAPEGALRSLDKTNGPQYRKQYFMRRAIATAVEFQQTVEHIAGMPEFREIETSARDNDREYDDWLAALEFFRSKRRLLKTIRNDVGGHFGEQATSNAFELMSDDFVVRVEVQYDSDHNRHLVLPFATQLAAAAFVSKLPGSTAEEKANALTELLGETVKQHAISVVHFLVGVFLWPRMA